MTACSGQGHPCIENERTIDHGVYGQVVYKQFDKPDTPLFDVKVTVTGFGGLGSNAPVAMEDRSNEDGLYEIELTGPGTTYSLCSDFAMVSCWTFTSSSLTRIDLVTIEGQVYWDENAFGECPD